MKKLLSYRDQRLLKISELLILGSRPIAIDEIMKVNHCSLKTVYADIECLGEFWGSILNIENFVGSIYSANTSIADLMKIRQDVYGNTLALRLALNIYFYGGQTVQDLSKTLHYSESKIRKEITACNQFLKNLNIQIVSKDALFSIEAEDEATLAYLVSLAVLSSAYPKEVYENRESLIARSQFEEIVGISVPPGIREEILLADYFYQTKNPDNSSACFFPQLPEKMKNDVKEIIYQYVSDGEEVSEIIFNILQSLYFKASIFRDKDIFFMNRYSYFYYYFRLENRPFLERFEDHLLSLEQKWNLSLTVFKEELLFLIYINMPNIRDYRECKIAVYSDLCKEHAEMLAMRLKKSFVMHEFSVFDEEEQYHLVLSTSKSEILAKNPEARVIEISDFITADDYYDLYQALYYEDQDCGTLYQFTKAKD